MNEPSPYFTPRPEESSTAQPPPDAPEPPADAAPGTDTPPAAPAAPEPAQDSAAAAHATLAGLLDEAQGHAAGSTAAAAQVHGGLRPLGEILSDAVTALEALKGFL